MDIYEIYNNAKENLRIRMGRTQKEVHDGEYLEIIVEISNPPRQIFSFLKEPSYAYDDVVLRVKETEYARPMDRSFIDGYRLERPIDPSEKVTIRVPLEAKADLSSDRPAEDLADLTVEAELRTDDLFRFSKHGPVNHDRSPPP